MQSHVSRSLSVPVMLTNIDTRHDRDCRTAVGRWRSRSCNVASRGIGITSRDSGLAGEWYALGWFEGAALPDVGPSLDGFIDESAEVSQHKAWTDAQTKLIGRIAGAIPTVMPPLPEQKESIDRLCDVLASPQLKSLLGDLDALGSVAPSDDIAAMRTCFVDQLVKWSAHILQSTMKPGELAGASQLSNLPTTRLKVNLARVKGYNAMTLLATQFFNNIRAFAGSGLIQKHKIKVTTATTTVVTTEDNVASATKRPRQAAEQTVTIDEALLAAIVYNFEVDRTVTYKNHASIASDATSEDFAAWKGTVHKALMESILAVDSMNTTLTAFNSVLSSWATFDGADAKAKARCDKYRCQCHEQSLWRALFSIWSYLLLCVCFVLFVFRCLGGANNEVLDFGTHWGSVAGTGMSYRAGGSAEDCRLLHRVGGSIDWQVLQRCSGLVRHKP